MSEQRSYILGGEIARRSWLGLSQPVMVTWGLSILIAVALYLLAGTTTWSIAAIIIGLATVFAATMEWNGQRSWASQRLHTLRTFDRRRRGEHVYRNPGDPAFGDPRLDPGWALPVPLGNTAPLDVDGTGLDDMFILRHANPGERTYFSVVLAVDGVASGLRGDTAYAATSAAFGAFLANMAKSSSFIRGIQLVHRSVPHDMAPHKRWAEAQVAALTDERLLPAVASYGALLDVLSPLAEEHRSYVCLRLPQTDAFMNETASIARAKNATIYGGIAQLVRDETERAARMLANAGMGNVEVYGERRACAVLRACIDPDFALARHRDATWGNCWPSYLGGRGSVAISPHGRWRTRVGFIPPRAIEPAPLGTLWLAPLLTGVEADPGDDDTAPMPTIRTVSVRMDFVPAARARAAARGDFTADEARKVKEQRKGKIDDGSSDVLLSASDRRRHDLRPGSGHHGVIYSLAVAVTGRDKEDLERACLRVTEAANDSAISEIEWATDDHDVSLFATLPLGRGLAPTSYTR
ncbi:SCO6880 family protein [Nocardia sp. NPDC058499]|uniref:SCO6880 family protein n=1 Tax=Nocardia sp. NPDC058499 TaxID=3346530 RepID=UPI00365E40B9